MPPPTPLKALWVYYVRAVYYWRLLWRIALALFGGVVFMTIGVSVVIAAAMVAAVGVIVLTSVVGTFLFIKLAQLWPMSSKRLYIPKQELKEKKKQRLSSAVSEMDRELFAGPAYIRWSMHRSIPHRSEWDHRYWGEHLEWRVQQLLGKFLSSDLPEMYLHEEVVPMVKKMVASLVETRRVAALCTKSQPKDVAVAVASLAIKWSWEGKYPDEFELCHFRDKIDYPRVCRAEWCVFFALDCNLYPFSCGVSDNNSKPD